MKIISSAQEISKLLCESIKRFNYISFAVAWASVSSDASKILMENKQKISYSTVGLHFYQTHPNFIKKFLNNKQVKFMLKKDGIFHPKIYLFFNDNNDWICLIGSANFTQSALTKNDEVMVLVDSNEQDDFEEIKKLLYGYHANADIFLKNGLQQYIANWKKNNTYKKKISEGNTRTKPMLKSDILSLSWDEYYIELKASDRFLERLDLLEQSNKYFENYNFQNLDETIRKNISGTVKQGVSNNIKNWFLFGRMPSSYFTNRFSDDDIDRYNEKSYKQISKQFNILPLYGFISKENYNEFIEYFKYHDGWGYSISTVSRLLAMRRPDKFFCLTKANEPKLIKSFGIKKSIKNSKKNEMYTRYWSEIIESVEQASWYDSDEPQDPTERKAWKGRVAMMDALFYDA